MLKNTTQSQEKSRQQLRGKQAVSFSLRGKARQNNVQGQTSKQEQAAQARR